jgi:hypothetical protein
MLGERVVIDGLEYEIAQGNLKILRRAVNKDIRKVVIRADVCLILEKCFNSCDLLSEVAFEKGSKLQRIEEFAFGSCSLLESITIPSNVAVIGASFPPANLCAKSCSSPNQNSKK